MQSKLSLGLALALSYFILDAGANSGYAATCNSIELLTPGDWSPKAYGLVGNCAYETGDYNVGTEISLDHCIVNAGGVMYAQENGGFSASCPSASLSGTVLTASCGNGAGGYVTTSLDLNNIVGNQNGLMCCFGICAV